MTKKSEPTTYQQLGLSLGGSPVSRSVQPGSSEARRMLATAGRRCAALLRSVTPIGLLLRMFVESSAYTSTLYLLSWKPKVTKSGRLYFLLRAWEPRTSVKGSGSWPTPKVTDMFGIETSERAHQLYKSSMSLTQAARSWPTPNATDGSKAPKTFAGGNPSLPYAVKLAEASTWSTPQARDYRTGQGARWKNARRSRNLNDQVAAVSETFPTPQVFDATMKGELKGKEYNGKTKHAMKLGDKVPGLLNPVWVEWLMGFPEGWTDLRPSETPSAPPSPTTSDGS